MKNLIIRETQIVKTSKKYEGGREPIIYTMNRVSRNALFITDERSMPEWTATMISLGVIYADDKATLLNIFFRRSINCIPLRLSYLIDCYPLKEFVDS